MAPNDLGLLSEVATALDPQLVDTSLIDPSLLDPPLASSSTSSHSIPQHSNQFNHSDQYGDISVGARSGAGEFQVGSSNGALSSVGMQIDPSLQSLSNEFNLDSMFNGLYRAESRHSQQDSDEEEEEDYSNSSSQEDEVEYQLEQTPRDVNEQILQLRDMDVEAERGLEKNSAYQKELTNLMARFQAASKRTTELKAFVKSLSAELLAGADLKIVAPGTVEPMLPWFKHNHGRDLPPNPDGEERDRYLKATRFWPWSGSERSKLKEQVMASNHKRIAQEATERGEDMGDVLASVDQKWYLENTEGLDWENISLVIKRRSALDCKIQWLQHDHPSLNFKKFTKDEVAKLVELVGGERGTKNWEEIAKALGNGRVGWDCLRAYRTRVGQKEDWTAEQDQKLRDAVRSHGENWQIVARVTGRYSNACINRWTKSLRPSITRGKWSDKEDEELRVAVAMVGCNWKEVAPRVTGRTDAQCRERWTNVLDPNLDNKKPWSAEDDKKLIEGKEAGKTWTQISKDCFDGTRTDNKCMRRYQELHRPVKAVSKKGKKKRQPKETDEEDNVGQDSEGSQAQGSKGPPKKRPKRAAKKKIPDHELGAQLAQAGEEDSDEDMGRVGDIAVGGGATLGGAYDILTWDQDILGQGGNAHPPQASFDPMMNIDPALGGAGGNVGFTNPTEAVKGKGKGTTKAKGKGVGTGRKPSTAATRGGKAKKKKLDDLGGGVV